MLQNGPPPLAKESKTLLLNAILNLPSPYCSVVKYTQDKMNFLKLGYHVFDCTGANLDCFFRTHFVVYEVILKIPIRGMIWLAEDEEGKHCLFKNCDGQVINSSLFL